MSDASWRNLPFQRKRCGGSDSCSDRPDEIAGVAALWRDQCRTSRIWHAAPGNTSASALRPECVYDNTVVRFTCDNKVGVPVVGEVENFLGRTSLGGESLFLVFSHADVRREVADLLIMGSPNFALEGVANMGDMQGFPFSTVQFSELSRNHGDDAVCDGGRPYFSDIAGTDRRI